ncbi:MAG: type II/IV secretion system protein [Alphaproteobacteria bacterium]|nr:type II/IV secretion system protein [Alphaproteobacteria bacterium]
MTGPAPSADSGIHRAERLARELDVVLVDPEDEWVDPDLIRRLSRGFAERHRVLPLHRNKAREVVVAMEDPGDLGLRRELEATFGLHIRPVVAPGEAILKAIYRHYDLAPVAQEMLRGVRPRRTRLTGQGTLQLDPQALQARLGRGGTAPYVELYNFLLVNAIERRASDIHLEPEENRLRVRFRIDGLLREALELPVWVAPPLASRIKVVAEMDVADSRRPQDGKASAVLGTRRIDLRVSTMPGQHGEKVVIRLLDPTMTRTDLARLGWQTESLRAYYQMVSRPQGLVLVVGPTGSGKSTTLYSTIHRLNSENTAIVTIEDPVEYEVAGVTQVQVNPRAGVDFASAIRAVLRQDPNVLVIGEVRDAETAKACVQAANTGHLVLSTLHTIHTISAIQRLLDLNIPAYMLSSTLAGIVAQRLVRRVCPHCSVPAPPNPEDWQRFGVPMLDLGPGVRRVGPGCPACQFVGYRGRLGIFELVTATEGLRRLLSDGAPGQSELWEQARRDGMITLFEDALDKVRQGLTTLEEIARTVPVDDRLKPEELLRLGAPVDPPEPEDPQTIAPSMLTPVVEPEPQPRLSEPRVEVVVPEPAPARIKLPALQPATPAPAPSGRPSGRAEILIVDDAEEILMMVEMALEDDYDVRKAHDGIEALEAVDARRPDLVVLDVMMPRMSGYEVCHNLKNAPNTADLPVLMLSARGETAHIKQGFYAGADDYLPKPFDPEELLLRIRALLRRSGRL